MDSKEYRDLQDSVLCLVCGKGYGVADGYCMECSSCRTCCNHLVCGTCQDVFNPFITPPCALCGSCRNCCTCCVCEKCKKPYREFDGLSGNDVCFACTEKVMKYLRVGIAEKVETRQIEHKVMNFYALSEIQGEMLRAKADEAYREKIGVALSEIEGLEKKFNPLFREVTANLARLYFDYLFGACVGEIGHLCRQNGCSVSVGGKCRATASREDCVTLGEKYTPEKSLMVMKLFFKHKAWKDGGSYGGPKWAHIADTGLMYFDPKIPPVVFLDHVVDLSHNGGLFLGKTARWFRSYPAYYLKLLDLKRVASVFQSVVGLFVEPRTAVIIKQAQALGLVKVECKIKVVKIQPHVAVEYGNKIIGVGWNHKTLVERGEIEVHMKHCTGYTLEFQKRFWEGVEKDSWEIAPVDVPATVVKQAIVEGDLDFMEEDEKDVF